MRRYSLAFMAARPLSALAFSSVTRDLQPGKIYGLIGRNGAGKTTLLSVLTAQNPATRGSVTLDMPLLILANFFFTSRSKSFTSRSSMALSQSS